MNRLGSAIVGAALLPPVAAETCPAGQRPSYLRWCGAGSRDGSTDARSQSIASQGGIQGRGTRGENARVEDFFVPASAGIFASSSTASFVPM